MVAEPLQSSNDRPLMEALEKADLVAKKGNRELQEEGQKGQRTMGVAASAIFIWITWMFVMPFLYIGNLYASTAPSDISLVSYVYIALAAMTGAIASIATWFLRKWAVWLFVGISLVHQVALIVTGTWNPIALFIPAVVLAFAVSQFEHME